MNDLCYCQYAFTLAECRVEEIGPGVDPQFAVELIREGPIAAVTSRVALDQFAPERLQGKTAEDIQWLGKVAARHNEIICRVAGRAAVLPLRLGTVFRSLESLQAMLARCRSTVAEFLERLGNRQEWGVKLYVEKRPQPLPGHIGPPPPHFFGQHRGADPSFVGNAPPTGQRRADDRVVAQSATSGTSYLVQKKSQLDSRKQQRAGVYRTVQSVEQRLTVQAERFCRIRNLPSDLTGRAEEMVFNAALLLPASAQAGWFETVQSIDRDVRGQGLLLEVTGPWPPYHFCPSFEM